VEKLSIELSFDDGGIEDRKISELLLEYGLTAIFYIPSCCELSSYDINKLSKDGFEIGGHTYSHFQDLKLLDYEGQYNEILLNKADLEGIIGKEITSFCYPRGKYNDTTVEVVKDIGFTSARTTVVGNIKHPEDRYRIKTSVHLYPQNDFYKKPDWEKEAYRLLDEAVKSNGYFHLWAHGFEIEKFNLWEGFDKFLKVLSKYK